MTTNQNELIEQFTLEARDLLLTIGERLLQVERAPQDAALLNDLFRQVHTLKGNCGLFEFAALESVVHAAEDLLDRVRSQEMAYSPQLADAILDAMDYAGTLIDAIAATGGLATDASKGADVHVRALRSLMDTGDTATAPPVAALSSRGPVAPPLASATAEQPLPGWVSAAMDHAAVQGQLGLVALEYTPEPGCFFKGEDPWRLARSVPGLAWLDTAPMEQPADNAAWDCYQCSLVFRMLSSSPTAYLEEHFRFVPEQLVLWLCPEEASAAVTVEATPSAVGAVLPPVAVVAPSALGSEGAVKLQAPDGQAAQPGAFEQDERYSEVMLQRARQLWRDQCVLLTRPDLTGGALLAVRRVLLGLLSAMHGDTAGDAVCSWEEDAPYERAALAQWARDQDPDGSRGIRVHDPEQEGPRVAHASLALAESAADAAAPEVRTSLQPAPVAEEAGHRVLKVSQDKIDRLMDLIGEMVVAKNALPYLAARAETVFESRELAREIKAQYAVINRIAEDMQHAIMQVRMLPIGTVFQRFGRLVRDISRRLGKDVRLVVTGEETEADKTVIEALAEPLVHILRNSLDHGVEMPEVRTRAGKSAQGTIEVCARQEGDRIIIDIRDDGAGIHAQRVKEKALQKGLITAERAAAMTPAEIQHLIFLPGFSTADSVSDLSGRGVGMDAVRSAVERLNGSVALHSEEGRGACVSLSLPLSMAVTNVMVVETAGRRFGIPMDLIVETVRVHIDDIHQFKSAQTAVLRGRIVPLRAINDMLALCEPQRLNGEGEHAVLVVRTASEVVGLIVDDFHGTCDIILKPMEGVLAGLTGFAGTALMGDGSVLLVLNPKELI
ncbi:chemotaxis protein CheA [Acidovorax lacteus]|uniref:histidine kinase n=1 Tax=Acidovorax lacteus TaxID=1924988 RepID=A0ABP8L983_9BURK